MIIRDTSEWNFFSKLDGSGCNQGQFQSATPTHARTWFGGPRDKGGSRAMARWPIAVVSLLMGGLVGALVATSALQGQAPSTLAFPKELASYRDIVKGVLPAVVSVESKPKAAAKNKQAQPRRRPRIEMPGLPEEFRRFFEDAEGPDGLEQLPQHSFGSGFIIDPKGVVLTNFHVVAGADRVEIKLKSGQKFTSTDIKGDRKNDLAIVRIKAETPLPYLELGDSDAMEIGDRVLAVGAPFGLTGSVTAGIVSAKDRSGMDRDRAVYEDYLQTDAAINPGNSGGPLVNLEGKVVGINTAIKTRTGGFQGVGLAITSNLARKIVDQLVKEGVVHRGYLGVQVGPLEPDVASQLGVDSNTGIVVTRVFDNTPASKGGIQAGDIITTVGGKTVRDGRELQRLVGTLPLKKPVDVNLIRDGKTKVVSVTIEEQPAEYGLVSQQSSPSRTPRGEKDAVNIDKVGMEVSDLTDELAEQFGYKEDAKGVVITSVEQGGIASEAGLRRGLLVVKIDKKPVTSASTARAAVQKGNLEKGVLLQIQLPPTAGGGTTYVVLKAETADK
jgi:serine protease Do